MADYKKNQEMEAKVGATMAEYQKYVEELTGVNPRGQLGAIEVYKIARKACEDLYNEKYKNNIVTGIGI